MVIDRRFLLISASPMAIGESPGVGSRNNPKEAVANYVGTDFDQERENGKFQS